MMSIQKLCIWVLTINSLLAQAAPVVQKIINNSQVGFVIVLHSDASSCSLHQKNIKIEAKSTLVEDFLLEPSVKLPEKSLPEGFEEKSSKFLPKKLDKASLILRPAYYYDEITNTQISLLDDQKNFDEKMVEKAFFAWKKSGKKRKFSNAQEWLNRWIGKDIVVVPDALEASGYIMQLSRIRINNQSRDHGQWLSFAKGVFSRLIVDIDIDQHDRRGIIPTLKITPGEGGVCTGGIVDRI